MQYDGYFRAKVKPNQTLWPCRGTEQCYHDEEQIELVRSGAGSKERVGACEKCQMIYVSIIEGRGW